jgi:CDP-diacylglycerol pyrophosphatase
VTVQLITLIPVLAVTVTICPTAICVADADKETRILLDACFAREKNNKPNASKLVNYNPTIIIFKNKYKPLQNRDAPGLLMVG